MDELGNAVIGLCNVIPGGVVCFFPSYGYMQQVYDRWQKQGIITRMSVKKAVRVLPGGLFLW